jgi:alpha-L-fucosidase
MWYDVPQQFDATRGQGVIDYIRTIQPDILVNNRTGAKGDFDTPEQRIGSFQTDRPWETCMTIATQWAWKPDDPVKPLEQCLQTLVRSAGGDGNLLFNVGPRSDGTIEPLQAERLREMGRWLEKYGYSIYGTRGGPFKPTGWGVSTRKGNQVFLHLLKWNESSEGIQIPDIGIPVKKVTFSSGESLKFSKTGNYYFFKIGDRKTDPIDEIIKVEYVRDIMKTGPYEINSR